MSGPSSQTTVPIEAGFSGRAITCEEGDVVSDSGGTVVVEVLCVVTDGSVEVVLPPMTTGRRSSVLSPAPAVKRHETADAQTDEDDAGGSSHEVVALLPPRAGWRLVLLQIQPFTFERLPAVAA